MNESTKLYSLPVVILATLLGGPIGGGICMRRNSINLGRSREGNIILGISILLVVMAGYLGFLNLEGGLGRFLQILIPIPPVIMASIYTEKLHGAAIKIHQQENRPFYSIWRVIAIIVSIGAVLFALALVGIFATYL